MRELPSIRNKHASISAVWLGIADAILITLIGTAATSRTASANDFDRADLDFVLCVSDGIELTWRTEKDGQAAAPDGWKVEGATRFQRETYGVSPKEFAPYQHCP